MYFLCFLLRDLLLSYGNVTISDWFHLMAKKIPLFFTKGPLQNCCFFHTIGPNFLSLSFLRIVSFLSESLNNQKQEVYMSKKFEKKK